MVRAAMHDVLRTSTSPPAVWYCCFHGLYLVPTGYRLRAGLVPPSCFLEHDRDLVVTVTTPASLTSLRGVLNVDEVSRHFRCPEATRAMGMNDAGDGNAQRTAPRHRLE